MYFGWDWPVHWPFGLGLITVQLHKVTAMINQRHETSQTPKIKAKRPKWKETGQIKRQYHAKHADGHLPYHFPIFGWDSRPQKSSVRLVHLPSFRETVPAIYLCDPEVKGDVKRVCLKCLMRVTF